MKHLRFALPLLICLSVVACNNVKKNEKTEKSESSIEKQISIESLQSRAVIENDQPASIADIERFYEVIEIRDQIKQMSEMAYQQIKPMIEEAAKAQPLANQEPFNARFNDLFFTKFSSKLTSELLLSMAPIYAKHFTKNDIDAIVAFYASPVGKKFVAKGPEIAQESMQLSFGMMQKHIREVQEEIKTLVQEVEREQPSAAQVSVIPSSRLEDLDEEDDQE